MSFSLFGVNFFSCFPSIRFFNVSNALGSNFINPKLMLPWRNSGELKRACCSSSLLRFLELFISFRSRLATCFPHFFSHHQTSNFFITFISSIVDFSYFLDWTLDNNLKLLSWILTLAHTYRSEIHPEKWLLFKKNVQKRKFHWNFLLVIQENLLTRFNSVLADRFSIYSKLKTLNSYSMYLNLLEELASMS